MMAEEEPLLASPPTQDVAVHVRDYARFTKLLKWGAIVCLIIGLRRPHDPANRPAMKIAVLKEAAGETRCAAIPETVKKFAALGAEVAVEKGAGEDASIADADFEAAGATIGTPRGRAQGRRHHPRASTDPIRQRSRARRRARCWSARSIRSAARARSTAMPRPGSRRWRWSGCRASPAPSRWTSCRRSRTSPATRRWSTPPPLMAAPSR